MKPDRDLSGAHAHERISFRLSGRSVALDRRVNAVRGDLADLSLAGVLFAPHYAKAQPMHCAWGGAFLRESGAASARAVSQLLSGETFHVLDITGNWAWGFCDLDGYVGYVERDALASGALDSTHRVTARVAPIFTHPDIKSPVTDSLPAGARIVGAEEGDFIITNSGAVHRRHVLTAGSFEDDWVAAAERQIGQPYVWGGRGHGGIDCSGLLQLALCQAGVRIPRDSDLQRESIGTPIADDQPLQRGDVIFFPGHVGIMVDGQHMLHANAYWMSTLVEPLGEVIERLRPDHERPVLARRRVAL